IDEYFAAYFLWLIVTVAWTTKALAWKGFRSQFWTWTGRASHALTALAVCMAMIMITKIREGDKPWSNLAKLRAETSPHVSEQQRAEPKPSIEPNPVTETHGTSDKLAAEVHHSIRDAITATVKRAPKPDTGLPSSYVQTFDGGPCDPKLKPYTNASRGLFTRPENVLPECQNSTNGRK